MRTDKTPTITLQKLRVLNVIDEHGAADVAKALRLALDVAIYGYELVLDKPTREELFYVKDLMDAIDEVAKEEL